MRVASAVGLAIALMVVLSGCGSEGEAVRRDPAGTSR